ncbi:hypothetical protein DFH11DRAFT_1599197 [Phellopilus nigrolimitatus]|nr:hypothetical protein DFH11DRAFT_1599197 [Phellopilus nigrolimitatus]
MVWASLRAHEALFMRMDGVTVPLLWLRVLEVSASLRLSCTSCLPSQRYLVEIMAAFSIFNGQCRVTWIGELDLYF